LIITWVFEKNANFFAENWQKSPKIVIITSTPGFSLASSESATEKAETFFYKSHQLKNFITPNGLKK
jgi:hypothetical protein